MLDLAVVSGMTCAAPVGAAMLTLPVRCPRKGGQQDYVVPATLSDDRPPFAVSSAGVP